MIRCLVIDDEQHAIDVLTRYIEQVPGLELANTFDNPLTALQRLPAEPVDLIFLDVHMPQLSGIDFIKAAGPACKYILCTAYPNYAVEGFDLDVLDYLVKPVAFPRFLKSVQKALDVLAVPGARTGDDFIVVKSGTRGGFNKISLADIRYAEGMKNYVSIRHGNEKTMALLTMKELEDRLPSGRFIRVHKSFIVAMDAVKAVEGNTVLLKDTEETVLLGESFKDRFLDLLKNKLLGR